MQHLVDAVRDAVAQRNWYAALAVALTLPDICGRLEEPAVRSQARFESWYRTYLLAKYQGPFGPNKEVHTFLNGADCYALRCAFLHQGEFDIDDQKARLPLERFHFSAPREGSLVHMNTVNGEALQLQVDRFCLDVCDAVDAWMHAVAGDTDVQRRLEEMAAIW